MPKPRKSNAMSAPMTIAERIYASYANLAMAHAALGRGIASYDAGSYAVRARLQKGLRSGTMNVGSLFDDVRELPVGRCAYCGAPPPPALTADHLIPRARGGPESGDNLVWACRPCNSRKNKRDLLEWYEGAGGFPPLALLRRYLKLALAEIREKGIGEQLEAASGVVTFELSRIPLKFPPPSQLCWLP